MKRTTYPSIKPLAEVPHILDHRVEVYEKLDGANVQLWSDGERLQLATRSGDVSSKRRPWWYDDYEDKANAHFAQLQQEWNAPLSELLPPHLTLFGEWLAMHTISYDPERMNHFYLLDVYDHDQQRFLPYQEGIRVATHDGLLHYNTLETLAQGRLTLTQLNDLLPGSAYRQGEKEGLVIKAYHSRPQIFAKLLHPQYEEIRKAQGINAYLTQRRLEKVALEIQDRGQPVSATLLYHALMRNLRKEVPFTFSDKDVARWFHRWDKQHGHTFFEKH